MENYKYIYYWLYTWQKKLWGEDDVPEFSAVLGMSMSLICLFASIAIAIELVFDLRIIASNLSSLEVGVFGTIVILSHYFIFMHQGKFRRIEEKFGRESMEERKRKGKWVLLYTFGSITMFIFILIYGAWLNHLN